MKTTLSDQQTAFYTKNGYIEFELAHPAITIQTGRDLWRQDPKLQEYLTRKLGPLALVLTGKKQLRLACDQSFAKENRPKKASPIKEHLSIQGLALGVIIALDPSSPTHKSPLGILPLPSTPSHLLFFRPELILDWPHLNSDIYMAFFALPNAVYIHNPKDPSTNALKHYGYNFGDQLINEHNPLIL